jgi:hypothetical protein
MDLINIFRLDDDGLLIEDSCADYRRFSGKSAPKAGDKRALGTG